MRALLLLLICLITIDLSAQEDKSIKRISTGIKIGSEIGMMDLESSKLNANTELDIGYSIVVDFLEYHINNKFSANIGIGFANRKFRQYIENVSFIDIVAKASGREHLLVQNIEMPITGKYYLDKNNKRQFYMIGGMTIFYNLHHSFQQELFFSDGTIWEYNHKNDITRTTFAATLGAGLQVDTDYRLSYIIEPILQVNRNQITFLYGRDSNALISVGLMAGVKF
ncbi:MAG: outer membrane beta-barrel protein [Saprospiraceae bacterium]